MSSHGHPDHSSELPRLNRVEGQIAGIKKMIEERRYCTDIIQQVRATRNALFKIESSLMETHILGCVSDVMNSKNKILQKEKLDEVIQLFKKADSEGIEIH